MSAVVADTHTLIWYLTASGRLSIPAMDALNAATATNDPIYASTISYIEILYLVERGRLPADTLDILNAHLDLPDAAIVFVAMDLPLTRELARIPREAVPDMPDRIIAATALYLCIPLVTRDLQIQALTEIETIW